MKWEKLGLIFCPDGTRPWAAHSALQPTPIVLDDRIRVFAGMRDAAGMSSVGWVDLDRADPTKIMGQCERPALTSSMPGTFDENGVVPCAVVEHGGELRLYYAGYQLGHRVRFTVFSGLAVSKDRGVTFERVRRVPVLERADEALLFRVAHTVLHEQGVWRVWYGAGSEFRKSSAKSLPVYDIRYMESKDGLTFPDHGEIAVPIRGNEYRVGRPYVIRRGDGYLMFYGASTEESLYRLGYAESADGRTWTRRDEDIGIEVSPSGWDSEMIAYPSVVTAQDRTYLFYNGNDYGRAGFGCAVLTQW